MEDDTDMVSLLVIADDFTGALDTGVQFSKKHVPTLVTTNEDANIRAIGDGIEVLVVDIESRHLLPEEAYSIVRRVVRNAVEAGVPHFYKKTDSALRGNIGAELSALLDESKERTLAFVPAFPKSRRTTVNGIQYVDGTELGKSVFSEDPFEPVRVSSVADIIHQQTTLPVINVSIGSYSDIEAIPGERTICVYDAQSDGDMERLGAALKKSGSLRVLAGCAGFAETLPELMELQTGKTPWEGNKENILIVSGSVNQITIDQMNYAKKNGYHSITLSAEQKLDRGFTKGGACEKFVEKVSELLSHYGKVIMEAVSERGQILESDAYARKKGIPQNELRCLISENIGEIVRRILNKAYVGNLVVFGGDTLYSIMQKIGCDGIVPLFEISPGVVVARIISESHGFCVITKSGGLGNEDVIKVIDKFVFESQYGT
jgi:uncharacterized protein YgbK (DUF1537 family)